LPADARGALRFEAVSVAARRGPPLLDAVSIDIPAGSKVVRAARPAPANRRWADLLRRFLEPDSGSIRLDGRPLGDYRLADLRRRIVVVRAFAVLFRGSILDNLRYGHPQVDEASVLAAARGARVDEFVADLPQGYATASGRGRGAFNR